MTSIAIHRHAGIAWQAGRCQQFVDGLKALGLNPIVTNAQERIADVSILFGTTFWRSIERHRGDWLLVDRASVGDPEYVQLVWNGHGRRGNHRVPRCRGNRWKSIFQERQPWRFTGSRVVLCGQTETYSPNYASVSEWYCTVKATHFRRHPSGGNPTGLPETRDWRDVGRVITLNSSVGVESVMNGIPTVTMDEGAMAWDVTAHDCSETHTPCRRHWLQWLAWTQWRWQEIEQGEPIRHLFEEL